jgi:transposase-like protein
MAALPGAFMRNLHTTVSAKHALAVTAAVKTIFATPTPTRSPPSGTGRRYARHVVPEGDRHDERHQDRRVGVHCVPDGALAKVWSNNPIERLNKAIKRPPGKPLPRYSQVTT